MKNSETVMLRVCKHAHDELFDVANALENEYGRRVTASDAIEILVAVRRGRATWCRPASSFGCASPGGRQNSMGMKKERPAKG